MSDSDSKMRPLLSDFKRSIPVDKIVKLILCFNQVTQKRSYNQACAIALALDVVGERWTLLVIRELVLGPRRYSDLLAGLPGIATNLLAERLGWLETGGLAVKRVMPRPSASTVYELTARGRSLEPLLIEMGRFGASLGPPSPNARRDPRWAMLSLKRRYVGTSRPHTVAWQVDDQVWTVRTGAKEAVVSDGAPDRADLKLKFTRVALVEWLLEGTSAAELAVGGGLRREGPVTSLREVARAFGLVA